MNTGILVIVAYRPRPGLEAKLLELTREHVPILRAQGLATERPAYAMRSADGTIIEVFEWKSQAAIDAAHVNAAVLELWRRYSEVCEYTKLVDVKESRGLFAQFTPIATT